MAPDLDIFIPTGGDPTAGWYWHRGPSHALAFIPIGALIVWACMLVFGFARRHKVATYLAALLGYATHGLLDGLTSYGTMLLWPFSDVRVSWDIMPIIDPVFTLTLVVLAIVAVSIKRWQWSLAACVFMAGYFGFATWQHSRAINAATQLADNRGHDAGRLRVMPAPGAVSLYRAIYEDQGDLHADAVFVPYLVGMPRLLEGTSATLVRPDTTAGRLLPDDDDPRRKQYDRFRWFSDDRVVAPFANEPLRLGDGRYSADPSGFTPLWGVDFSGQGVRRFSGRDGFEPGRLLDMIFGNDPSFKATTR